MALLTVLSIVFLGVTGSWAQGCTDVSPDTMTCPELIAVGSSLCMEDFFVSHNYCAKSCGRAPCPSISIELQQGADVMLIGKKTGERREGGGGGGSTMPVNPPAPAPVPVPPTQSTVQETAEVAPAPMDTTGIQVEEPVMTEPGTGAVVEEVAEQPVMTEPSTLSSEPGTGAVTEEVVETTEPGVGGEVVEFATVAECQTPAAFAAERSDLSIFLRAAKTSGLLDSLNSPDLVATMFVPSDGAFRTLLSQLELSEDRFFEGNPQILKQLLELHILPGVTRFSGGWQEGEKLPTMLGGDQVLEVKTNGGVTIQSPTGRGAQIIEADKKACKAVIHVINNVLIPAPVVDLQALIG